MNENVVCIIPARFESKRFPGKALVDIEGKSMINHIYNAASQVCETYVATDNKHIKAEVESFGGKTILTSSDHQNGTSRVVSAYNILKVDRPYFDLVINVQGDEPTIKPKQIQDLIDMMYNTYNIEVGTLKRKIVDSEEIYDQNVVKVIDDKSGKAIYFSRLPIESLDPFNTLKYKYYKHVGIYAFRPSIFKKIEPIVPYDNQEHLEQLNWMFNGIRIGMIHTDFDNISVDVIDDVDKILKAKLL